MLILKTVLKSPTIMKTQEIYRLEQIVSFKLYHFFRTDFFLADLILNLD